VPDAEIIPLGGDPDRPIGTRGKPGRGTGSASPSSSSRGLAGSARSAPTPPATPRRKATTKKPPQQRRATPAKPADQPAQPPVPPPDAVEEPVEQPAEQPAAASPLVAHAGPRGGIPVVDWLAAFTSASKELFGESWEPRLADFLAFLRRRLTGDYVVDEYGFDAEITQRFFLTALRPIAEKWFRIEVRGIEYIPTEGGALVVSNHSGTVPVDGLMTGVTIHDHTGRFLRPLGADLVFKMPVIGELARKGGATLACNEDAERMLRGGELVGVWPEGFKGIGKPFAERYKLQRFGRGGFVSAAMRTGVPIVPTSVVGAEEIYPLVGNVPSLARLLGVPYIPITPLFPLLGPLGLVPLPSKWLIEFGEPIRTDSYDAGAADDPMLVFNVTDQVRETIQQTLYTLLKQRTSVFR
jgi:1-acyl-sn-glycerol-3-phosphate acyltransferase